MSTDRRKNKLKRFANLLGMVLLLLPSATFATPPTLRDSITGGRTKNTAARNSSGIDACQSDADCNDMSACTVDVCDRGSCTYTQTASCVTTCKVDADCQDGDPLTADHCNNGVCENIPEFGGGIPCNDDLVCDDDNACTTDSCVGNICRNIVTPGCVPCNLDGGCLTVEVVFVMDTSGSLTDDAIVLCAQLEQLVSVAAGGGVTVIPYVYGVTDVPAVGYDCLAGDIATIFGIDVPGGTDECAFPNGSAPNESWGPGTAIIADRFPWAPLGMSARLIIPISDEAACNGSVPEGCGDPGDDRAAIESAIDAALANHVFVSPVLSGTSDPCVINLSDELAERTGGVSKLIGSPFDELGPAISDILSSTCIAGNRCDDGDACTSDVCGDDEICVNEPTHDPATQCCDPVTGDTQTIDDDNDCTEDICDQNTGALIHRPLDEGTPCDDGDLCTEMDACDADGLCVTLPVDCDDGIACTSDACDPLTGSCVNAPDNALCDNGLYCDGVESCDPQTGCVSEPAPDCDDGVDCTVDVCDDQTDTCTSTPNDALCDNGAFCDGDETCDAQLGCLAGDPARCEDDFDCTIDTCDEANDKCDVVLRDDLCDNGNVCDGYEVCDALLGCMAGQMPNCSDANECTIDFCDVLSQSCVHLPDDSSCDDGVYCNGAESCDAATGCESGPEPDCDDGVDCTVDVCDEDTDTCMSTPSDALCDNGAFCDGDETCDAQLGCMAGEPARCDDDFDCTIDTCDELNDKCDIVPRDEFCDNGNFCDGPETCDVNMGCVTGEAPDCSDTVECTMDSCDEQAQECVHMPDDNRCDDGMYCNGLETCDPDMDCQTGQPPICDDQNVCTNDSCDLVTDDCSYEPDFDVSSFCCDPMTGELTPTDDGNPCTDDVCDVMTGQITHVPTEEGTPCDDGVVCTIFDTCDGEGGCSGVDPITVPCERDDECDGQMCDVDAGYCICKPELCLEAVASDQLDSGCHDVGEDVIINVVFRETSVMINGGQVVVPYDPDLLQFISIDPGQTYDPQSPFDLEVFRDIDEQLGRIVYAVGISPMQPPAQGPVVLATIRFHPLIACIETELCFFSENPLNTILTLDGDIVPFTPCCTGPIIIDDGPPTIACPQSVSVPSNPGELNATVTWDPITVVDMCDPDKQFVCTANHESGLDIDYLIAGGGVFPFGASMFQCTATDSCGATGECNWSVTVTDKNFLEATVQLSPTMMPGPLTRCIEFEFFSSCAEPAFVVTRDLNFGLPFDLPGRAKNVEFAIPAGEYFCVTARDPAHSLRSLGDIVVAGDRYFVEFRNDPSLGGNWLIGGNLNGDDVIDVMDAAFYIEQEMTSLDPHTPCNAIGVPHADVNGDGIVDMLDWSFIQANYLVEATQPGCCLDNVAAFAMAPRTTVSVEQLFRWKLGHLAVADLNNDGHVDDADITLYNSGVRPIHPERAHIHGGQGKRPTR